MIYLQAAAVTAASASVVQTATHVQITSGGKATGSQIINATAIPQVSNVFSVFFFSHFTCMPFSFPLNPMQGGLF